MAALSYEEREALIEELDMSMSAKTAIRFCQERGYDITDEKVLDSVFDSVYQCGYRWAERDADPYW